MLLYGLLLAGPEAEVAVGAGGELVGDGVVGQALDGVVVRVLEDALQLARPNDDALVGATCNRAQSTYMKSYTSSFHLDI